LGWRPIFLINLPIGVIAVLAARRTVRESRSQTARRLDLVLLCYKVLQALKLSSQAVSLKVG
jgi:predicted MFS family arabinose efflux permease